MSTLSIRFFPEIPTTGPIIQPLSSQEIENIARHRKRNFEVDLIICIDEQQYGYYPQDILGVLTDISAELIKIKEGIDHGLEVSGYSILYVRIRSGFVYYYTANIKYISRDDLSMGQIGSPIPVQDVVEVLQAAASAAYHFIAGQELHK